MTATAHALVGGALAASVNNPTAGILISAASHPLLDMIPHWDFGWGWRKKTKRLLFLEGVFDLSLGILLSYLLFGQFVHNFWYFAACIFAAEVWDLLEIPYWFLSWKFPPFSTIYNFQYKVQGKTKTMFGGILTQVATVTGIIILLQRFVKF
jgi:hypothetical protein